MVNRMLVVLILAALLPVPLLARELDQQQALEFVKLCRSGPDSQPSLRYIYWKLKICQAAEKPFDVSSYRDYIIGLQNADGGFGLWPKDVSTPEATLQALTILQKAQTQPADRSACIKYLRSSLAEKADLAKTYSDLAIQRDIHACLMSLAMLGGKLDDLDKYLKILEQDSQAWGMHYRITAGLAFGRQPNRQRLIKKLDAQATDQYLRKTWSTEDQHYALETMHLLGGEFTYKYWLSKWTYGPQWEPWKDQPHLSKLVAAWRRIRMAGFLDMQTPWLEKWLKESASVKPSPVGGFASMPGLESDPRAGFLAYRLLGDRKGFSSVPAPAKKWQDKQQEGGFYESSPEKISRWFTKQDQLIRRIDHTWEASVALELAGEKPKDSQALLAWLNEMLDKRRDELRSDQLLRVLECFQMLGKRPKQAEELAEYFQNRFGADLPAIIKASSMLGVEPKPANAGDQLSLLLDRVRTLDIPMEISVLAASFEALDLVGEDYAGAEYYFQLLGRLQNPDGGVRKPDSPHSNIYDTIAALRLARLLPALEERRRAGRKTELIIRAARVARPVKIDGKLSEWAKPTPVSFQERSDRPINDRNTTKAYAMWDDKFLYLAFWVSDTNLQAHADQDTDIYRDDGIEFILDPDLDRTRTYMPDDICVYVNLRGAVLDDRGLGDGRYDNSWHSRVKSAFELHGTINDDSDVDVGYVAEIALPFSDLGWQPGRNGSRLGINLCVNDRDQEKDGYKYSAWADTPKFHVPRDWGLMKLVGPNN